MATSNSENTFVVNIREDWTEWKEIIIPLISFEAYGEPTWFNISYLRIGIYNSLHGTWNLDDIGLTSLETFPEKLTP